MAAIRHAFPSHASLPTYARTAGRAVHVNVWPRPSNISDSRKILGVLQQYGKVVMYQHLKYDPATRAANTVLAIYKERAEAEKLLDASPLIFESRSEGWRLVAQARQGERHNVDGGRREPSASAREFQLRIEPSTLNHQAQIQRQYYYNYFKPDTNNITSSDLVNRVPVLGMADCQVDKGEVPMRLRSKRTMKQQLDKKGPWRESLSSLWKRGREENAAAEPETGSRSGRDHIRERSPGSR